jgi:hypothetical protein
MSEEMEQAELAGKMIRITLFRRQMGLSFALQNRYAKAENWEEVMAAYSALDVSNQAAVVDFLRQYFTAYVGGDGQDLLRAAATGFTMKTEDQHRASVGTVPVKGDGNPQSGPLTKVIQEIDDYMADEFYEELRPEVESVEGRLYALKVFMDLPDGAGNETALRQILVGPWPPACIKVEGTGSDRIKNLKAAITTVISNENQKHQ